MGFFSLVRTTTVLVLVFIVTISSSVYAQQQYWNEAHLFVMVPPSGWTINEKVSGVVVRFELREGGTLVAIISVQAGIFERLTLADVIPVIKKTISATLREFQLLSERPVTVAGVEGYEGICTWRPAAKQDDITMKGKLVILRRDPKFYFISYEVAELNYDRYLSEVDRSIGSFRFAEKLTIDVEPRVASVAFDGKSYSSKDLPRTILVLLGQAYTLSVESTVSGPLGTRYLFIEWSDGGKDTSRKITVTRSESYTAKYKTQYELTIESEHGSPQGSGWYDSGATATFSVISPIPVSGFMGTLGAKIIFDRWSGDSRATTEKATISIDSPKKVVAVWRTDYTQAYIILGAIIAVVAVLGVVLFMKMRKVVPAPLPPPPPPPPTAAVPAKKYCMQCGAEMPADAVKCPKCGELATSI